MSETARQETNEIVRTLGLSLADALREGEAVRHSLRAIYCGHADQRDWDAVRDYLDVLDRNAAAMGKPL